MFSSFISENNKTARKYFLCLISKNKYIELYRRLKQLHLTFCIVYISIKMSTLLYLSCAITGYYFVLGLYRLYFHPLAGFPGPKLAALTLWYEFYFDVYKKGRYLWKIQELHEKYGL